MRAAFDEVYGVISTKAGYIGGISTRPTSENYAQAGHYEAVAVVFYPGRVSLTEILSVYFNNIDPGGQFKERGNQFTSVIFWTQESQKPKILEFIKKLTKSGTSKKPIVTKIEKAGTFYPAEEDNQHYEIKQQDMFLSYYNESGRKAVIDMKGDSMIYNLKKKYTKPLKAELKKKLNSIQYYVTQESGTEAP